MPICVCRFATATFSFYREMFVLIRRMILLNKVKQNNVLPKLQKALEHIHTLMTYSDSNFRKKTNARIIHPSGRV